MPPVPAPTSPVLQMELCAALGTKSGTRHFQAQSVVAGGLFRGIVGMTVWSSPTSAKRSTDRAPGPLDPGGHLAPGAGQCCGAVAKSGLLPSSASRLCLSGERRVAAEHTRGLQSGDAAVLAAEARGGHSHIEPEEFQILLRGRC